MQQIAQNEWTAASERLRVLKADTKPVSVHYITKKVIRLLGGRKHNLSEGESLQRPINLWYGADGKVRISGTGALKHSGEAVVIGLPPLKRETEHLTGPEALTLLDQYWLAWHTKPKGQGPLVLQPRLTPGDECWFTSEDRIEPGWFLGSDGSGNALVRRARHQTRETRTAFVSPRSLGTVSKGQPVVWHNRTGEHSGIVLQVSRQHVKCLELVRCEDEEFVTLSLGNVQYRRAGGFTGRRLESGHGIGKR